MPKTVNKSVECYIARDRSANLIGFYTGKPTEVVVRDSEPPLHYYRGISDCELITVMSSEAFISLFKFELQPGDCNKMRLTLSEI